MGTDEVKVVVVVFLAGGEQRQGSPGGWKGGSEWKIKAVKKLNNINLLLKDQFPSEASK